MRNRIFGAIAVVLGLLMLVMLFTDDKTSDPKMWITALIFLLVGGWQLFSGNGMASLTDFIVSGKLSKEDVDKSKESKKGKSEKRWEKPQNNTASTAYQGADEALVHIFLQENLPLLPKNQQYFTLWQTQRDQKALKKIQSNLKTVQSGARLVSLTEIDRAVTPLYKLATAMLEGRVKNTDMADKFLGKGLAIIARLVKGTEQQNWVVPEKYMDLLEQFIQKEAFK